MADSIYTFDPVPANNTALDSIPYGPNQLYHNQIDNWFRALASKLAQHVDDLGGVNTVAGTANAITVTLASGITAYATGQLFWFKNTVGPNTTATFINVNSIGSVEIRLQGDTALSGGEMVDNGYYGLLYDAAYDGAAGGFVLLNPSTASVAAATTSAAGIVELATLAETLAGTDTSRAVVPANLYFPTGHLYGLTLSNNVSDATNDIDIAAGTARDGSDSANMILASALTKRLDAAWAVGTGNGGLDTGSIANTTYHVWLIKRSDTGVVDALFSTSASSPTMPTNYDYKRRIGSIIRASAAILAFSQSGDTFTLTSMPADASAVTLSTTAANVTLTVPPSTIARFYVGVTGPVVNWTVTLTELTQTDVASTIANAALAGRSDGASYTGNQGGFFLLRTNASSQIRIRSNQTTGTYNISTIGWIDTRGTT